MANLLKVDFKRVLKDKLFLIMCILAGVFGLITPLLTGGISLLVGEEGSSAVAMLGLAATAQDNFFQAMMFGSDMGLIAPILLAIILCKDFGSGTVRNKLIGGYSRTQIFFSMYLVCTVVLFGVVLLTGLLSMGVSLFFFPFSGEGQTVGSFFGSLGLEVLVYLAICAMLSWLCALRKNVGIVIVLYAALTIGLSLITMILSGVIMLLENLGGYDTLLMVLRAIQTVNICDISMSIGGTGYETKELLGYIIVPLAETGLLLGWSVLKFKKRDLK